MMSILVPSTITTLEKSLGMLTRVDKTLDIMLQYSYRNFGRAYEL